MAGGTQRQTVAAGNGVIFEVVFKNADPRKKPTHDISLSYGGQVYRCNGAASIGSVHTIDTDDEDDNNSSRSHSHSKRHSQDPSRTQASSPSCLKKSPARSVLRSVPSLKASPKKPKRSRTLSPSHHLRARSILAPFSNLSRKISMRRHSYDEGTKTRRETDQVQQEKTRSSRGQRPVVQNIPHGFQQAPPQFTYHNQLPMYHYVPAPQPHLQSLFGAAPMAYPIVQAASNTTSQLPPGLQRLQGHINHATAILAANPIDLAAKHELDRLIIERNSFLDSATKRTAPASSSPVKHAQPETDDVRSIAENKPVINDSGGEKLQGGAVTSVAPGDAGVDPKEHHVCSGCGEERSPSFHWKHPFTKPVHNVCRKCRDGRRANSVMNRYHFCDGCGIVRSKEYHRRRRGANSASKRSKICRKCHAIGNYARRPTVEAFHGYGGPGGDKKHREPVHPRSASHREPVKVEPPVRPGQPRRRNSSADHSRISGYDGVTDLDPSIRETARSENPNPSTKEEALDTYRSPGISDEDVSSNQPASLESSFHSSGPDSPVFKGHATLDVLSPDISLDSSASESGKRSFHDPQHTTPPGNPYYRPRVAPGRLSSPFHYNEASTDRPSPDEHPSPQDFSSRPSAQHSGPSSPNLRMPSKPRFVDRNQSWPGDLNRPCPGAFLYVPSAARKVSASDGAKTPQLSPSAPGHPHSHKQHDDDGDVGAERFTTGAFGKLPSASFKPSPPASPWASFSGPIPNPASDAGGGSGSKGAFYHEPSSSTSQTSAGCWEPTAQESVFGSYNTPPPPPSEQSTSPTGPRGFPFRFRRPKTFSGRDAPRSGEFASTRGAWNINTEGGSASAAFTRRGDGTEHVPEPIIEEPSSPLPNSPAATPLLLEFHLAEDLSDSGVEFLTGSSSPSCSSLSSPSS